MATKIPAFSTSCAYDTELEGGYWYIRLKSGGNISFTYAKNVDVFLCGGGGGGGGGANDSGGGGGGGGYTNTVNGLTLGAGETYAVVVGNGGSGAGPYGWDGTAGEASYFLGYGASGGGGGKGGQRTGGSGTGQGGTGGLNDTEGGNGGIGVLAFERGSIYYGGGGGGGAGDTSWAGSGGLSGGGSGGAGLGVSGAGVANTGGGGGGGDGVSEDPYGGTGGAGGSGVVIIRGSEDDFLPVYFNGTRVSKIIFNGVTLTGLVKDGTRIFAKWLASWRKAAIA